MSILIVAEHDNTNLAPATLRAVTAAKALGDDITVAVLGFESQAVAEAAAGIAGVKKVVHAKAQTLQHPIAENIAPIIAEIAKDYDYVLATASAFSKNIIPRVAAMLDVGQITDVIQIIDNETFRRPIYAGNAIATVKSVDTKKVLTIRATAFDAENATQDMVEIDLITPALKASKTECVEQSLNVSERPELTQAKIIVSGGRALQTPENFKILEALADKLGAAIGASRAAVDAGLVPNDYQVGQTGKVVAPELYIAVGISGAIQHIAGMKDSKVIVAINKDQEAPIFKIANYGLVGDLFELVPELTDKISL